MENNNGTPLSRRYSTDRFIPLHSDTSSPSSSSLFSSFNTSLQQASSSSSFTSFSSSSNSTSSRKRKLSYSATVPNDDSSTFSKLLKLELFPSPTGAVPQIKDSHNEESIFSFSSSPMRASTSSSSSPALRRQPTLIPTLLSNPLSPLLLTRPLPLSHSRSLHLSNTVPYKVLDAPSLVDDFYCANQLDWSRGKDVLVVGMGSSAYTWDAKDAKTMKLCDFGLAARDGAPSILSTREEYITAIKWLDQNSNSIIVCTNTGAIRLYEYSTSKLLLTLPSHTSRISSLSLSPHPSIFSAGSKDGKINTYDVRLPNPSSKIFVMRHKAQVVGLTWENSDGDPSSGSGGGGSGASSGIGNGGYLASGDNDNKVFLWDFRMVSSSSVSSGSFVEDSSASVASGVKKVGNSGGPIARFKGHTAAVRAMCWSPHEAGLLATGGGTSDGKIRFWDAKREAELGKPIDTGSQVLGLIWSRNSNEIVSTSGYSTKGPQNQIRIWNYNNCENIASLSGHSYRPLHFALSPNGQSLVSGAGDETIRFWELFPQRKEVKKPRGFLSVLSNVR